MTTVLRRGRNRVRRIRAYAADLWSRREFAWYMAMGNLKSRNASTALGLLWWVLNPLLLGLVYFIVFGLIFIGNRPEGFLAYLMSGMFVFQFTSMSMSGGANSILQNSKLLVNLRFPRLILPVAHLIEAGVGFLASLIVLFAMVIPTGVVPGPEILLLVVPFTLQLVFNLGLAAVVARLAIPFRDINNLVPYLNRMWLYMSPIIWPLSYLDRVPRRLALLIDLNPMTGFLSLYRSGLLGYPFEWSALWGTAAWSIGVGLVGVVLFVKYESRMARYL
jgi:teichoic acid transport system permease protein